MNNIYSFTSGLNKERSFFFLSRGAIALLSISGFLMLVWSFAVPIYEAPDEGAHWQYARYLHDNWKLPLYDSSFVEANSPPLYYGMIAPIAFVTDEPSLFVWADAEGKLVFPQSPRIYQTTTDDIYRYWPIRVARLLTGAMSLITVLITYYIGKLSTASDAIGVIAGSAIAFLPMFTFRGVQVSNDALVGTFGALTTLSIVWILRNGFAWNVGIVGSVALGLAFLTKISAVFFVIPLLFAIFFDKNSFKGRILHLMVFLLPLIIVAPWIIRNQILYGDVFASGEMLKAVPTLVDIKSISSPYFYTTFLETLFKSTIGVFGHMNVFMQERVYTIVLICVIFCIIGSIFAVFQKRIWKSVYLSLVLIFFLGFAIVVHINLTFTQPQGRYLLPGLPALSVIIAIGIQQIFLRVNRFYVFFLVSMAISNICVLGFVIIPTYWPPIFTSVAEKPVVLLPTTTVGLDTAAEHGLQKIVSSNPYWVFNITADASELPFMQFHISGYSSSINMTGRIYFLFDDNHFSEEQSILFNWKADGKNQWITVPMYQNRTWVGTVRSIYIEPFHREFAHSDNNRVRLDDAYLTGHLR